MLATVKNVLEASDGKMLVRNRNAANGMEKVYEGVEMSLAVNNHLHNNHLHNIHGGSNNGCFFVVVASHPNRNWRRRDGAGVARVWMRNLLQILAYTKILRS